MQYFREVVFWPWEEACRFPPIWIPEPVAWSNFPDTWNALPFDLCFLNSAFVSLILTVGQLANCSLGAFAFARLHFPGREKLLVLYLATLMIPFQMTMITLFVLVSWMGWIDSYWGLTVPWSSVPMRLFCCVSSSSPFLWNFKMHPRLMVAPTGAYTGM